MVERESKVLKPIQIHGNWDRAMMIMMIFLFFLVGISLLILLSCGSPIRSLIETGFYADKRSDVRLYYGARNLQRMAYQV